MTAIVYIVRCSDGSYYVGITGGSLDDRVAQHYAGNYDGCTARRRPVILVFTQEFARITDAIAAERQIKGWGRAKEEALIRGGYEALPKLARGLEEEALKDAPHWHNASFDRPAPRASSGMRSIEIA